MSDKIEPFVINAIGIVKSNISLLSLPIIAGLIIYVPASFFGDAKEILSFPIIIASLLIFPLIYGRYIELINDEAYASWYQLFKKYFTGYPVERFFKTTTIF